jgi:hypothetical protein
MAVEAVEELLSKELAQIESDADYQTLLAKVEEAQQHILTGLALQLTKTIATVPEHAPKVRFSHLAMHFFPNCTACSLGFSPPVRSELRSNLFLCTFLLPRALLCEFQPARKVDLLPILALDRHYFAGKPPFTRLRPCSDI